MWAGVFMRARIFLHGLESSNQGAKSVFFRERYPDMIIPHFVGSLQERMAVLNGVLSDKAGIVIVGSSFGGLMGAIFAMENEGRVERLVLLAPAINLLEATDYQQKKISVPVTLYHGRDDDVIPLKAVQEVAAKVFADLSFQVVDDDHFLHKTFKTIDWDRLLS
ncbi:MAG: alpha/beta hydrolase [Proteobacteria bacterium]|nr:alpha/beta hydrolase [Pseudomonadota bacterium]